MESGGWQMAEETQYFRLHFSLVSTNKYAWKVVQTHCAPAAMRECCKDSSGTGTSCTQP